MLYVNAQGARIPALGYGTWQVEGRDAVRMVRHVLAAGYRHIDTAQIYENEAEVGEGIEESDVPRNEIFLTTKVWVKNFKAADFVASVDDSLRKLRTDYVDLLLLHWPSPVVPLAEQIYALNAVRKAGKARHIGISNYTTTLLKQAVALSEAPLITNQIEFHPYLDQSKIVAAARAAGMCVTAYYAMAEGKVLQDPLLQEIAANHKRTPAQVALRWVIQQGVVALSRTVHEEYATSNLGILDFFLTSEEMSAIHGLARPDGRLLSPDRLAPEWD